MPWTQIMGSFVKPNKDTLISEFIKEFVFVFMMIFGKISIFKGYKVFPKRHVGSACLLLLLTW